MLKIKGLRRLSVRYRGRTISICRSRRARRTGLLVQTAPADNSLFNLIAGGLAPGCRRNPAERPQYLPRPSRTKRCIAGMDAHQILGRSRISPCSRIAGCRGAWRGFWRRRAAAHPARKFSSGWHLLRRANTLAGALTLLERKRLEWARARNQPHCCCSSEIAGDCRGGVSRTDRDIKQVHASE